MHAPEDPHYDIGLIGAPPYNRDTTSYTPNIHPPKNGKGGDKWMVQAPPADDAEWGRWAGTILQAYNRLLDGSIHSAYIWNEPNANGYLPLPWDEMAPRYVRLFHAAVPEIRKLNPSVKIGGPVITGGGVLGWSSAEVAGSEARDWNGWLKAMLDTNGAIMDQMDIHLYRLDSAAFRAEYPLIANYCQLKGLPIKPLVSSEGSNAAGMPHESDPVAGRWRYNTVFWADDVLTALDDPGKVTSMAYFWVWDGGGQFGVFDRFNYEPKYARPDYNRMPIYYFYWVARNLRGRRLAVESPRGLNVVAAATGATVSVVVQNLTGLPRPLAVDLPLPAGTTVADATWESYAYTPGAEAPELRVEPVGLTGGRLTTTLAPYALADLTVRTSQPVVAAAVRERKDFFGDQVFVAVPHVGEIGFTIALAPEAVGRPCVLKFGTAGIPYTRPADYLGARASVEVRLNGHRLATELGKFDEVMVPAGLTQARNRVTFRRLALPADHSPFLFSPDGLAILWTALAVTEAADVR